jgi:hypothetical protein
MQQSSIHSISELGTTRHRARSREALRIHNGSRNAAPPVPVAEASPLHSVQTIAATMFVMTVAAGWIATAALATAPLIGAGELLSRAGRTSAD